MPAIGSPLRFALTAAAVVSLLGGCGERNTYQPPPPAEVSVAINEGTVGQITLTYGGERSEHIARSADGRALARGADVVITGLRGDTVIVEPAGVSAPGGTR